MPIFDERLNAILSPPQLERFCERFGLRPAGIEPVTTGWVKNVLLARGRAFVFPRDPHRAAHLGREVRLYRLLSRMPSVPAPRLLERVRDRDISYHEFLVVTRPRGIPFSDLWGTATVADLEALFTQIGRAVARWHSLPPRVLRGVPPLGFEVSMPRCVAQYYPWLRAALSPSLSRRAAGHAHRLALRLGGGSLPRTLRARGVAGAWGDVLGEIAGLEDTVVHGDLHDDQVFVLPRRGMRITGVLDWEAARLDRPVLDFDLAEWGMQVWEHGDRFLELRRSLWRAYLRARRLRMSSEDGLHLLYTLAELMGAVGQRKRARIGFTGKPFPRTVRIYLERLAEVTELL